MPVKTSSLILLNRRMTLKSVCALAGAILLAPRFVGRALADQLQWPKDAFAQKSETDALKTLYNKEVVVSDKISLDVPEIAENGAVVPVSVSTTLPNVTSVSILIPKNPFTLAANYVLPKGTEPNISCRLKMGQTSEVVAIVESDGKLFAKRKQVKVTLGGCGG